MELWHVKVTIPECIGDFLFSCATIIYSAFLLLYNKTVISRFARGGKRGELSIEF